jgi:hypothetical protein
LWAGSGWTQYAQKDRTRKRTMRKVRNWMTSASSDIKSLVRWITVGQSVITINTLGFKPEAKAYYGREFTSEQSGDCPVYSRGFIY